MDFTYSEEQEAVRELAGRIFSERATHERLKEIETAAADEGPFDRDLWGELIAINNKQWPLLLWRDSATLRRH